MKYRKPMKDVQDRHILIELGGDFINNEIRHILNHAYLEHKAPHEYDELKKYIKDLVIGKHNSVYVMNNGSPDPLASASILASPYISNYSGQIYYDYFRSVYPVSSPYPTPCPTNNSTNCNSNSCGPINWAPITVKYNNGEAWQWGLFYTYAEIMNLTPTVVSGNTSGYYITISPQTCGCTPYFTLITASFGYAPYVSSTNPFILTTYFYWNPGSSPFSSSYVYFTVDMNCANNPLSGSSVCGIYLVPLFYSAGQYNFNSDTYYISIWQWTYN